MTAPYRETLKRIRLAFAQPVSDRVHDSYITHSIMRALDLVDEMKSELPILGQTTPNDYEAGRQAKLATHGSTVEAVTSELVRYLEGMTIFGQPRTQQNVVNQPSIPSVIGVLLAALYNPNLGWDEYSRRVALAEVEAAAMTADLVGYDPAQAAGVFTTFGVKEQEFDNPAFRDSLLRHNDYNRRVFQYVHDEALAGRGVTLSLTDCYRRTSYGEPIVALKSFILSPFVDEEHVEVVVQKVLEAQEKVKP